MFKKSPSLRSYFYLILSYFIYFLFLENINGMLIQPNCLSGFGSAQKRFLCTNPKNQTHCTLIYRVQL